MDIDIPKTETDKKAVFVLNWVNIISKVAPELIFYIDDEIDEIEYENGNIAIEYTSASKLDFANAGA